MSEVKRYTMAAAYAGPVVALDDKGQQFTNYDEHLPPFVLASDYDRLAAELATRDAMMTDMADTNAKLRAKLSAARADAERIRYLHEQASIYASALGREEPNTDDYVAAVRDAIDAARAASSAGACSQGGVMRPRDLPNFYQYKLDAEGSFFAGTRVSDMDRDELLAIIGWLYTHYNASRHPGTRVDIQKRATPTVETSR